MKVRQFIHPSDKQIQEVHGDIGEARKRMLDQHYAVPLADGVRFGAIDFAAVPGGKAWQHPYTAEVRKLLSQLDLLDGGEVGASLTKSLLSTESARGLHGPALITHLSRGLLRACIAIKPDALPNGADEETVREAIRRERKKWPTGYFADVQVERMGSDAMITATQVGDVYIALDTAGRMPEILEGTLEARPYAGELIIGEEKGIDVLKGELKKEATRLHPTINDQFFYHLLYNGILRPDLCPPGTDAALLAMTVKEEMGQYALRRYPSLTDSQYRAMIEHGMTPWQQDIAQNNPKAGPLWYPALDAVGDTPEDGIKTLRLRLPNIGIAPHPRIVVWTDGSTPADVRQVSMEGLRSVNAYGERTEMELTIDGNSGIDVQDMQK